MAGAPLLFSQHTAILPTAKFVGFWATSHCKHSPNPFVVTAFMRSIRRFRCPAPMNRGTTNGSGECLLTLSAKRKRGNGLRPTLALRA